MKTCYLDYDYSFTLLAKLGIKGRLVCKKVSSEVYNSLRWVKYHFTTAVQRVSEKYAASNQNNGIQK